MFSFWFFYLVLFETVAANKVINELLNLKLWKHKSLLISASACIRLG